MWSGWKPTHWCGWTQRKTPMWPAPVQHLHHRPGPPLLRWQPARWIPHAAPLLEMRLPTWLRTRTRRPSRRREPSTASVPRGGQHTRLDRQADSSATRPTETARLAASRTRLESFGRRTFRKGRTLKLLCTYSTVPVRLPRARHRYVRTASRTAPAPRAHLVLSRHRTLSTARSVRHRPPQRVHFARRPSWRDDGGRRGRAARPKIGGSALRACVRTGRCQHGCTRCACGSSRRTHVGKKVAEHKERPAGHRTTIGPPAASTQLSKKSSAREA